MNKTVIQNSRIVKKSMTITAISITTPVRNSPKNLRRQNCGNSLRFINRKFHYLYQSIVTLYRIEFKFCSDHAHNRPRDVSLLQMGLIKCPLKPFKHHGCMVLSGLHGVSKWESAAIRKQTKYFHDLCFSTYK